MIRFHDRVAVVTGARSGLGRAHALGLGVNVAEGKVAYPGVAEAFGMELHDVDEVLTPPARA